MCVCVRERETDRQTDRERERERARKHAEWQLMGEEEEKYRKKAETRMRLGTK